MSTSNPGQGNQQGGRPPEKGTGSKSGEAQPHGNTPTQKGNPTSPNDKGSTPHTESGGKPA
jgi:hypothetical protein